MHTTRPVFKTPCVCAGAEAPGGDHPAGAEAAGGGHPAAAAAAATRTGVDISSVCAGSQCTYRELYTYMIVHVICRVCGGATCGVRSECTRALAS